MKLIPRITFLLLIATAVIGIYIICVFDNAHTYKSRATKGDSSLNKIRLPRHEDGEIQERTENRSVLVKQPTKTATSTAGPSIPELPPGPFPQEVNFVLHNASLCSDPRLVYIIYVHSGPANFDRRRNLRQTWGNRNLFLDGRTNIVFMLGATAENRTQQEVEKEFDTYGDIVQGDFPDAYKNLTLKALMALKWVSLFCTQAQYAIKADDDAFVNIFEVVKRLPLDQPGLKSINCRITDYSVILRVRPKCDKWCVSEDVFPGKEVYPPYCTGLTYIMSRDLVPELYKASRSTPYFWIDDLYVTGVLPHKVHDVHFVDWKEVVGFYPGKAILIYENNTKSLDANIFVNTDGKPIIHRFWAALLERLPQSVFELLDPRVRP